jgi:hypothetical protein
MELNVRLDVHAAVNTSGHDIRSSKITYIENSIIQCATTIYSIFKIIAFDL